MINKYICIAALIILSYSCKSNKCSTEEFESHFTENADGDVDMAGGIVKIISRKGNTETVKELDSCGRTLYMYQRLKISEDSSVPNGYFKAFYINGQLRYSFNYKNGMQTGVGRTFWLNGNLKSKSYKFGDRLNGPQSEYDSSGVLQLIKFYSSNSTFWFYASYDKSGEIDSLKGRVFYIPFRVKEPMRIGENLSHMIIEVPKLNGISNSLKITIKNGGKILLDTSVGQFYTHFNTTFNWLNYRFESNARGKNELKIVARLTDSSSHRLLKTDSFKQIITVQ